MSDSTGAEEEGHSLSEKDIQENLEKIFVKANGRIITATFSSLINRIQQIITLSEKYNRKVVVGGFSMKNNIELCRNLGYMKMQKDTIIDAKQMGKYPDNKITFICTGAQGEESAMLMRITNKEYKHLKFGKSDTVIFSSSVIPGNERSVQIMKDEILRQGARVFHYKMMDIHAGGHAQRDELRQMIKIMNPKFLMPIHGQHSMMFSLADIGIAMGIPANNIPVIENGRIVSLNREKISVEKGKVPSNYIMVDGLGVGDVGEIVLKDRQMLAQDGMFTIVVIIDKQTGKVKGSPDIISRGFVYLRESKPLLIETRKQVIEIVTKAFEKEKSAKTKDFIKDEIRKKISQFLFTKTQRRPIVLPVVIEV
jgi:ribonuclease J